MSIVYCMFYSQNNNVILHVIKIIAKDCLHTGQAQACTRITLLVGCSFVRLSPCRKWPNTQNNGCWLPHSNHIHGRYPFSDQKLEIIGQASLLHGWHWILFNPSWVHCASGNFYHIFLKSQCSRIAFQNICFVDSASLVWSYIVPEVLLLEHSAIFYLDYFDRVQLLESITTLT